MPIEIPATPQEERREGGEWGGVFRNERHMYYLHIHQSMIT